MKWLRRMLGRPSVATPALRLALREHLAAMRAANRALPGDTRISAEMARAERVMRELG